MPGLKAIARLTPISVRYVQTAAAGTAPDSFVWANPTTSGEYFEVIEVRAVWDVVGGASAAADVKIVPSGTALASGTTVLASTFDLTTGARTPVSKALTTTTAARLVKPGDSIAVDTSGTLTGLAGLTVEIVLKPIVRKAIK